MIPAGKSFFTYLISFAVVCFSLTKPTTAQAQLSWFADGYHGGMYGHYPMYVTKMMADTLSKYPDWKINLEIEPETWDSVQAKDQQGYTAFKKLFEDQSLAGRIEYTNPSYAQSYLFPVSGESIIRQFQYGMKKLKQHFPGAVFTTYSSEEPCFTSALPQILKSLGFTNAVLKNPNTCWGGYTRAYGGETVNWIGPDGTSITAVPRYASEALEHNSTWQTTAWNNSKKYLEAAVAQNIQHPVGMCLQDAGWRNGRWLGNTSSHYTTWRAYFASIANQKMGKDWRLSQEDIQVSLVWGSQVLQRIAQQVRQSENKILSAEKMASLAKLYAKVIYPSDSINAAWRPLMLSQHHDCWIVPYNRNGNKGLTWAGEVNEWTECTNSQSEKIIRNSAEALTRKPSQKGLMAVYNTSGYSREEVVAVPVILQENKKSSKQSATDNIGNIQQQLIKVEVPAMGYVVIDPLSVKNKTAKGTKAEQQKDGTYLLENDVYRIVIDPATGGSIKSLVAKNMDDKEFVDGKEHGFNSLRGNFYKAGGLLKSTDKTANVVILENNSLRAALQIRGTLASHTYIQTIQLTQGDDKIDCQLQIEDVKNLRVGEDYKQDSGFDAKDVHKAFYNDTCKLLTLFPLALQNQKVHKDAPFDVTESQLENTFFNRWDSIKNNIIFNWVDITDGNSKYGLALLTDHTTSYTHGATFPLGLTVQYAGVGLWGRNYKTDSSIHVHYALIPHAGTWDKAMINKQTELWNTPLLVAASDKPAGTHQSFTNAAKAGWQITSLTYEGNDLLVRLFNAEGDDNEHDISFSCTCNKAEMIELNNKVIQALTQLKGNHTTTVQLAIPRFGIRTIKLTNAKS